MVVQLACPRALARQFAKNRAQGEVEQGDWGMKRIVLWRCPDLRRGPATSGSSGHAAGPIGSLASGKYFEGEMRLGNYPFLTPAEETKKSTLCGAST